MSSPPSDETIFAAALERPAAERAAFLASVCAGDPVRQEKIAALLRAHAVAPSFLATSASPAPAFAPRESPGDRLGRYQLLQKIGEGGCGIVYLAEQQEPVVRRVALKVIKLGMDTREVVARFEAERQALALMSHPNIASVLDGGATDTGRPYFVMELVRGVPITKYCDEQNLPTAARLELFTAVCHAVQHAHQKGIIHRDLKPSNILVTLHDGKPVPKVIDFGIAKATQGKLTNATLFTAFEQFIGTPAYMSPEQAELSGLDIDTRSDIYSLGVLLYELLAGRPPFDPKTLLDAGLDEIRRIIREVEPPRPSTRLSTLTDADQSTIAKQRATAPAHLSTLLRGDLDWIVMRCLEKDRTRRYETANGLADDILRFLQDEPVAARPPSAAYRIQKLMRRHRLAVGATAAVALALVLGLVASSWQAIRATRAEQRAADHLSAEQAARREAEAQRRLAEKESARALAAEALAAARLRDEAAARQEAERQKSLAEQERNLAVAAGELARIQEARARAIGDFLTQDLLGQASPTRQPDRDLKLRTVLDRAAQKIDGRFARQPQVEVALRQTLAQTYRALGDYPAAQRQLEGALALARPELGAEHPAVLVLEHARAVVLRFLGQLAESEALARRTWEIQQRTLGPEHLDTLATLGDLAICCRRLGRQAEAETLSRQALDALTRVAGRTHPHTLATMTALANSLSQQSRYTEAGPLYAELVQLHLESAGPDHPETLGAQFNLALNHYYSDQLADAERLYGETLAAQKRILGPEHPDTQDTVTNLGALYNKQGRFTDAEALLRPALELATRLRGADHPSTQFTRSHLATTLSRQNRLSEAEPLRQQTLEIRRRTLGAEHPNTLESMNDLATCYRQQGKLAAAEALFAETLEIQRRRLPPAHASLLLTTNNLGATYLDQGKFAAAIALLGGLREDLRRTLGPDNVRTLNAQNDLAFAYRRAGRLDEAVALMSETLAAQKRTLPAGRREILISCNNLYQTLQAAGKFSQAAAVCAAMAEENRQALGPDHDATLMFVSNHALALCLAGQPAAAVSQAEESLRRRRAKGETDAPDTLHTLDILATALSASHRGPEALARAEEAARLAEARRQPTEGLVLYLLRQRASAELDAGRLADAQSTLERVQQRRQANRVSDASEQAAVLTLLGRVLLRREKFADAEPHLRAALALRTEARSDEWRRFETQSLLGASLLGQGNLAAAEAQLLSGWAGLEKHQAQVPYPDRPRLREALAEVVRFYQVTGSAAQATEWSQRLRAWEEAEARRFQTAAVKTALRRLPILFREKTRLMTGHPGTPPFLLLTGRKSDASPSRSRIQPCVQT